MASQLAPLNVLRGAAFIAVAVLVFACMDAMSKHLATAYNVPLVVALRYFGNLVLLVAIVLLGATYGQQFIYFQF